MAVEVSRGSPAARLVTFRVNGLVSPTCSVRIPASTPKLKRPSNATCGERTGHIAALANANDQRSPVSLSIQPVLHQFPIAHDQRERTSVLSKQADIFRRITVDDDQIGEGVGCNTSEFSFHLQDLGTHRRCLS